MSAFAFFSGNYFSDKENYFFILVGIICLVGGLRGVLTRRGRTRSKGGYVKHYSGKGAVIQGVIGILLGIAAIAFGAVNLF
jgi:hypothetical protein